MVFQDKALKESISWQVQGMVREVQISWRGGGLGGAAAPPRCSKNKEFVLMLHGNLRCLRQEPLKRKVAFTLLEFPILL